MSKIQTLRHNYEFRRAYHRGSCYRDPALVTYCCKNRAGLCRIGITASKKIGNAVQRNRARRVIMAAYASLAPELEAGVDLVFVARTKTVQMKSTELARVMRRQLAAASLLSAKPRNTQGPKKDAINTEATNPEASMTDFSKTDAPAAPSKAEGAKQ